MPAIPTGRTSCGAAMLVRFKIMNRSTLKPGLASRPIPDPLRHRWLVAAVLRHSRYLHRERLEKTTFNCCSIAAALCTDKVSTLVQNLTTVQFLERLAGQYDIQINAVTRNMPFLLANVYGHDFIVGLKSLYKWDVLVRVSAFDDGDVWEDDGVPFRRRMSNARRCR